MPLKEFAFLHANFSLRKPFFPSIFQRDWNAKTSGTFMWRIRVNAHSSHVCIYHGCLFFFIFTFHASHFVTRQENGGRERERLILAFVRERIIEEESKKLDPFWRWVRVWRTIGTWIDQQFFAFSSDNLNPFKDGSLGKKREGIRM